MRILMKELWQFGYHLCVFRCSFSADTAVLYDFSYFTGIWEKSEKNRADAKLFAAVFLLIQQYCTIFHILLVSGKNLKKIGLMRNSLYCK